VVDGAARPGAAARPSGMLTRANGPRPFVWAQGVSKDIGVAGAELPHTPQNYRPSPCGSLAATVSAHAGRLPRGLTSAGSRSGRGRGKGRGFGEDAAFFSSPLGKSARCR